MVIRWMLYLGPDDIWRDEFVFADGVGLEGLMSDDVRDAVTGEINKSLRSMAERELTLTDCATVDITRPIPSEWVSGV